MYRNCVGGVWGYMSSAVPILKNQMEKIMTNLMNIELSVAN